MKLSLGKKKKSTPTTQNKYPFQDQEELPKEEALKEQPNEETLSVQPTDTVEAGEQSDDTLQMSGNLNKSKSKKKSRKNMTIEEQLAHAKSQAQQEKAGKRKIFHSLVKLANELRKTRSSANPALEHRAYAGKHWYEDGLWRAPTLLPTINHPHRVLREPVSLLAMFFNFVVLIAWTRVLDEELLSLSGLLYLGVLWSVWCKHVAFSTRFDMSDLSGQAVMSLSIIMVLFSSFTIAGSLDSADGSRVMMLAAAISVMHCLLHIRLALNYMNQSEVLTYAVFVSVMTLVEAAAWLVGLFVFSEDWEYRWAIFVAGIVLSLRVPRGVLPNDFGAACAQRNMLFIFLLGFLLCDVVGIANEFFASSSPTYAQYSFFGAICVMLLCIQFLYSDDADTSDAMDHAMVLNSVTGFFFHIGHFLLLASMTVLGSGLTSLTRSYFLETPSEKTQPLVTLGFAGTLLFTFFMNSLHVKRLPTIFMHRAMFVTTYVVQAIAVSCVIAGTVAMHYGFMDDLSELEIAWGTAVTAVVIVCFSYLDEILELTLYPTPKEAKEARVEPFAFWCCVKPPIVSKEENGDEAVEDSEKLTTLTPLLGKDAPTTGDYQSVDDSMISDPNV